MCSYCGCRAIPVIGRLSAEHVEIVNATGALRRAALAEAGAATETARAELSSLLGAHTTGEELGLFAELRLDPEFADHIDLLCAEHTEIRAHLARVTVDHSDVVALETLLRHHIDKEENGMFPAAAVALDGQAWERIEQRAPWARTPSPDTVLREEGSQ